MKQCSNNMEEIQMNKKQVSALIGSAVVLSGAGVGTGVGAGVQALRTSRIVTNKVPTAISVLHIISPPLLNLPVLLPLQLMRVQTLWQSPD